MLLLYRNRYRQKLEKRKREQEENEKAAMIQQMYRAKNKKKKLKIQKGSLLSLFKHVFIQKKTKKLQLYSVNLGTKRQERKKKL